MKIDLGTYAETTYTSEIAATGPISAALRALLSIARDAQYEGRFERADEILRQAITEHPLADFPVEALCPLTVRAVGCLLNANIRTVAELICLNTADLLRWKNFGRYSCSRIGVRLQVLGLNLAGRHDYTWITPLPVRRERPERLLLIPSTWPPTWAWFHGRKHQ